MRGQRWALLRPATPLDVVIRTSGNRCLGEVDSRSRARPVASYEYRPLTSLDAPSRSDTAAMKPLRVAAISHTSGPTPTGASAERSVSCNQFVRSARNSVASSAALRRGRATARAAAGSCADRTTPMG